MLDTLGEISRTDIRSLLGEWEKTTPLPFYSLGEPTLTKITNKGGEEFFVLKMLISNNSDYDGIIHMDIRKDGWWYQPLEDPRAKTKIEMPAHTSKEFVSVWEDQIRNVEINTMVSGNLPNIISQDINNVKQERNKIVKDSIYILPESSFDLPGEIIVDNEDSTLLFFPLLPLWGSCLSGWTKWRKHLLNIRVYPGGVHLYNGRLLPMTDIMENIFVRLL